MGTTQKEVAADPLGTWECLKPCDRTPRGGGGAAELLASCPHFKALGEGLAGLGALLPPGASAGGSQAGGEMVTRRQAAQGFQDTLPFAIFQPFPGTELTPSSPHARVAWPVIESFKKVNLDSSCGSLSA